MSSPARRRNTLLEALTRIKKLDQNVSVTQVQAFLYIAENPGINIGDVAEACGIHSSSASRIVKSLTEGDSDKDATLPLINILSNPYDAREKFLAVNEVGEELCRSLDYVISQGVKIESETKSFFAALKMYPSQMQQA